VTKPSIWRHIFAFFALFAILPYAGIASAQDAELPVTQTAEYDIGFDCPVASMLDRSGEILWVLMDNCGDSRFSLLGFNVSDGTPAHAAEVADSALEALDDQWIDANTVPIALTPNGALDILYSDAENYDTHNLRLPFGSTTEDEPTLLLTLDALSEIIPGYAGYPETTVYNAEHTLAAVSDTASIHVIDLHTGDDLLQIPMTPDAYDSIPSFSADGTQLYVATWKNIDDMDDYSAVLRVYSLPDGEVAATYDVPSALLMVSPNGQYAVASTGDSQGESEMLLVVELETGRTSAPFQVYEAPRKAECMNRESDFSDLDWMTSGKLPIRDITWLADSSGFFTVNSYLGEGAGGGAPCFFNYSRLRYYSIGEQ